MNSREKFEAWAYQNEWDIFRVRNMGLDHYADDFVDGAWCAWQEKQKEVLQLKQEINALKSSSAVNIPVGYKLVPIEPTEAMLDAARRR